MSEENINKVELQGVLDRDPKRYEFKNGPGFGYNVVISFPNVKKNKKNGTIYGESGNQDVADKLEDTRAGDNIIIQDAKLNVDYWTPDTGGDERSTKKIIMYEIAIKKGERKPESKSSGSSDNLPEGYE